ncbi:MAG: DUF4257 domain-containing protein [Candidatus Bathyarchaeota archaeon]|nr:DUF4257 domain-containing protein [Candidatus Bathyarchaeum sp.]
MALFGSISYDVLVAFALGALGGFAAELITNKGNIEFPHTTKKNYFDAGFLANIFLGGIAALSYFFVLDTTDAYKFVGAMIGAGVGGSAILTAIKEKISGSITQEIAEKQTEQAEEAKNDLENIAKELDQLKTKMGITKAAAQVDVVGAIDTLKNNAEKRAAAIQRSTEKAKRKLQELQ